MPDDFRSRCPYHRSSNDTALHVTEESSGYVGVYCFVGGVTGCPVEEIMNSINVPMGALFPPDHDYGRQLHAHQQLLTESGKVAASVIIATERLGLRADFSVVLDDCPHCPAPYRGSCCRAAAGSSCTARTAARPTFLGALAQQLHERRLG